MKQIRFSYLFFALTLVFFVLIGSPNLTGPRIGTTLGITAMLFILVGYIVHRTKKDQAQQFNIFDALFLGVVIVCMIAGSSINYPFVILIPVWILLMSIKPRRFIIHLLVQFFQGLTLFCIVYFGINQYDFTNLLKERVLWMALVFMFQYFFISTLIKRPDESELSKRIGKIKWSYIIALVSLGFFSLLMYDLKYLLYLVILSVPASFQLYKLIGAVEKERQSLLIKRFAILSIAALLVYNVYLFLDSTQVIQAVMGGY